MYCITLPTCFPWCVRIVPCITISACNCTPANLQISSHSPQSVGSPALARGDWRAALWCSALGRSLTKLDTVSQGQEEGGTSAGVRWVTRDQASRVMQVETVETLLAFHFQQLESSRRSRTFHTHSTHFIRNSFKVFFPPILLDQVNPLSCKPCKILLCLHVCRYVYVFRLYSQTHFTTQSNLEQSVSEI